MSHPVGLYQWEWRCKGEYGAGQNWGPEVLILGRESVGLPGGGGLSWAQREAWSPQARAHGDARGCLSARGHAWSRMAVRRGISDKGSVKGT